jgi:hypothetical protein
LHVAYNYDNETARPFVKYASRAAGELEFSPAINLSAGPDYSNLYPSMCTNDTGTVFVVVTYGNFTVEYRIALFYGDPPTHRVNISDEVDCVCDLWEVSVGWYDDGLLHMVHDDYETLLIDHVYGTPEVGWTVEQSISIGAPAHGGFHISPSLRWAYYFEPGDVVDYVFTDYAGELVDGEYEIFWLYYQDIGDADPPDGTMDALIEQIEGLTSVVVSAFSLLLVVVILRGVVKNVGRTGRIDVP